MLLYLLTFQYRGSYGRFIQHALQVAIITFKGDISVGIARRFGTFVNAVEYTRVGTLIVATIYLQLIQNRYMFQSFTVLQCSHQNCVQPVASDVEVVGYI